MNKKLRPLAFVSLGLLVLALLGPIVIAAFGAEELHDESISRIGTTQPPFLQIRLVLDVAAGDCDCDDMALVRPSGEPGRTEVLHVQHAVLLDERDLTSATVVTNLAGGDFNIEISFTKGGSLRFAEITRKNIGKRLALVIGGQLYCAPRVLAEILNGKAVITGRFSQQEAASLATKITDSIPVK